MSRLRQDTSTALFTISQWSNSFALINRIPLELLSLIPTYLPSRKDRLRASFVCRHWRKTFLQRAELWSQLYLSQKSDEVYAETFLERAKGSALDVTVGCMAPVRFMALLSSRAEQIKHVHFPHNSWKDVENFSKAIPGSFPLLHSLEITAVVRDNPIDVNMNMTTPSLALPFSNAINLKTFHYHLNSDWAPPLNHFLFPNLASLVFSAWQLDLFPGSELLGFLENSPMLRTVHIEINARISLEGVHQDWMVVLPNVEAFSLVACNGGLSHKIATHISCPSARSISLKQSMCAVDLIPDDYFPPPVSWNAIVRQYTRGPAEDVTLEIKKGYIIACKLTFKSAGATIIELCFNIDVEDEDDDEDKDEDSPLSVRMYNEIFTQATRTIRNHLQLADIKRLHFRHSFRSIRVAEVSHITSEAGRLFKSLGPLDELTIHDCNLRPCFHHYFGPSADGIGEPVVFPQVKELTISSPLFPSYDESIAPITRLARAQHTLGIPFGRVVFRWEGMSDVVSAVSEELRPWVGSVECYGEGLWGVEDYWDFMT